MDLLWMVIVVLGAIAVLVRFRPRASAGAGPAATKIASGAAVVDVRTPAEYASGHYEGARNIPLNELQARVGELGERDQVLVVYCASGIRSAQAAGILKAAGFTDVTDAGGLRNLPP
jgi:phage shock protein E